MWVVLCPFTVCHTYWHCFMSFRAGDRLYCKYPQTLILYTQARRKCTGFVTYAADSALFSRKLCFCHNFFFFLPPCSNSTFFINRGLKFIYASQYDKGEILNYDILKKGNIIFTVFMLINLSLPLYWFSHYTLKNLYISLGYN